MSAHTLGQELLELEAVTFEVDDIADLGQDSAAWCSSSCSCSSCCSCSTSSCCSTSTSTSSCG
ncbi:MAG TPA: thiazolylpeptide-type bacteriocin [Thermobifida alba]|nr:thiazolylpeptide-type bacteriocin [Thermobifida alba]